MSARDIKIQSDDNPTVFAKCPRCCRRGKGTSPSNYFGRSYTKRAWRRRPVCDNCQTDMELLFEVG